jgi:hypothetical protein
VVINSYAQRQLAYRTGLSSTVVPNVMPYEKPPSPPDGYADDLRSTLGLRPDEYFILQPTRIVPRKRIERALGLALRLGLPYALVISHEAGDEGSEYVDYLQGLIDHFQAHVIFGAAHWRGARQAADGRSLRAGRCLSNRRSGHISFQRGGFWQCLPEAILSQPLAVSAYDIYRLDIKPKGFQVVEFDEFITKQAWSRRAAAAAS